MSGIEIQLLWLHTGPQQSAPLLNHRGFGYWLLFHCLSPISPPLGFFGRITRAKVLSSLNQAGQMRHPSSRMWIMSHAIQTLKMAGEINLRAQPGQTLQIFLPPRLPGNAWFLSAPSLMTGLPLQYCVFTFTFQEILFYYKLARSTISCLQPKSLECGTRSKHE